MQNSTIILNIETGSLDMKNDYVNYIRNYSLNPYINYIKI